MPIAICRATLGLALALGLAAPLPLRAENAPPAAPSADPLFDAQKAAFEALPEADRRTIQDAMVWSGHYQGVVDGAFGKRTRDAILAYQTSVKTQANGMVDAAQLAAMSAAAQKARTALRFQVFTDEKTGIKIGAPLKMLDKRAASESGARLMKADGSVTLDLTNTSGGEAALAKLYATRTADAPDRKIAFKINRPDYFVISGEENGRKIYERVAKAPAGWSDPAAVRGFKLAYPAAQSAEFDRIAVAVASSFEPFPSAASTPAAGTIAAAPATPEPPPAPSRPFLGATGFVIAAGQAVTAISASDCPNPTIDGKPVKFLREDRKIGLGLVTGEFSTASGAGAPSFAAIGPDLVALTYASDEPTGRIALNVTAASPLPLRENDVGASLVASLSKSAAGSPVFDRNGALVAIIASSGEAPKLVAGVAPLAPHRAIGADEIQRFLSVTGDLSSKANAGAARGAGEIAAAERAYVVAISCRR